MCRSGARGGARLATFGTRVRCQMSSAARPFGGVAQCVGDVGQLGSPAGRDGGQDTLAASPNEREGIGELIHVLGQVDSTYSTVRDSSARPIPLLAWTEMPLLKA